jgi:hypothetical protein
MAYPVTFDIQKPAKFTRPGVFIRLIGLFILGIANWLVFVLLPLYAAMQISSKKEGYLQNETVKGWLRSYMALFAYCYLLTDEFEGAKDPSFKFDVTPGGTPTLGGALLRYITTIPHFIALGILGWVAGLFWFIGSVMILLTEDYPQGLYDFNLGAARWQARMLGYYSSLVQEYPPFALDMGSESAAPTTS